MYIEWEGREGKEGGGKGEDIRREYK